MKKLNTSNFEEEYVNQNNHNIEDNKEKNEKLKKCNDDCEEEKSMEENE